MLKPDNLGHHYIHKEPIPYTFQKKQVTNEVEFRQDWKRRNFLTLYYGSTNEFTMFYDRDNDLRVDALAFGVEGRLVAAFPAGGEKTQSDFTNLLAAIQKAKQATIYK